MMIGCRWTLISALPILIRGGLDFGNLVPLPYQLYRLTPRFRGLGTYFIHFFLLLATVNFKLWDFGLPNVTMPYGADNFASGHPSPVANMTSVGA
jgi:hypothetical protein